MTLSIPSMVPYVVGYGTTQPLEIRSNYFYVGDQLWRGVGMTAFLLAKYPLNGDWGPSTTYMSWARGRGINLLRVFSEVDWDGVPVNQGGRGGVVPGFLASDYPADHYDATLTALFNTALQMDLRIQIVVFTYAYTDFDAMRRHRDRIARLAAPFPNVSLQIANEPPVNKIDLREALKNFTPPAIWSTGQYDPSPYPAGSYMGDHPPRDGEWPRKFKGAVEAWDGTGPWAPFQPPYRGPYEFDEPIRIEDATSADDCRACGAGMALFGASQTIHGGTWAQTCTVPTDGHTLDMIGAWLEGVRTVPVQEYYDYQHPDDRGSLRRYRRRNAAGQWYEISVRPFEFLTL